MIVERMMELWLLRESLKELPEEMVGKDTLDTSDGKKINVKKMFERFSELQSEFVSPYVIDNPPKGV